MRKDWPGVVLPLFSLRRNNDHGIGDLTALRQWIDWAADAHVGFLQLLPVNALGRDECPSPYSAISSRSFGTPVPFPGTLDHTGLEERVFNETGDTLPWEQPSGPRIWWTTPRSDAGKCGSAGSLEQSRNRSRNMSALCPNSGNG